MATIFRSNLKVTKIKRKIYKSVLIKFKIFCVSNDIIKKMKRQPTEWEERGTNHLSGKNLIAAVYKECLQIDHKMPNYPSLKWVKT